VARKQIKIDDPDASDTFENERRIMRLLRLTRHENMVQLLASYSVLDLNDISSHFLLMPLADMRLTSVFEVAGQSKALTLEEVFGTEINLLRQIHGLSSALETLHFYESVDEALPLKGYHFDLDPRNILIQDGRLLLADFGLSRMKNESSDSCTPFHGGGTSNYTAPECIVGEQQYHGSKSDMWSFGGILCDLVAWMMGGVQLLDRFQNDRKRTAMGIKSSRFHIGGEPHPVVEEWMATHHPDMNPSHRGLCSLSKRMLVINPAQRPNSRVTSAQLFMIAAQAHIRRILDILGHLENSSRSWRLQLEHIKLKVWARHAELFDPTSLLIPKEPCWLQETSRSHKVVKGLLQDADVEVGLLQSEKDLARPGLAVFETLQDICEHLWELAPRTIRDTMARDTELEIRNITDIDLDEGQPSFTAGDTEDTKSNYCDLLQLAAMRKFTRYTRAIEETAGIEGDPSVEFDVRLFDEKEVQVIKPEYESSKKRESRREWSLVTVGNQAVRYLCEWVYYDAGLMDIEPQKLHRRVCSIVRQLSIIKAENYAQNHLKVLPCEGYFMSSMQSAFGILFRLPTSASTQVEPVSLNQILRHTSRPTLTEVFRMAKAVARSIFRFHGIPWVHKNISSHTLVFIDELLWRITAAGETSVHRAHAGEVLENESQASSITKTPWWARRNAKTSLSSEAIPSKGRSLRNTPVQEGDDDVRKQRQFKLNDVHSHYIVGFNHSRPDDKLTFTGGKEGLSYEYQHYKYANQSGQSFQSGYDYYSLGLVLLELGLWTSLDNLPILDQKLADMSLDTIQDVMYEKAVPLLGPMVGEDYQEAVRICLSEELLDLERLKVEEIFSKQVLARLESCHA